MKTKIFLATMIVLSAFAYAEAGGKSQFEISVGGSFGGLFSGGQRDAINDTVTPKPDSYLVTMLNLQAAYFPMEFLGVEGGANVLGSVNASSDEVSDSLGVYKFSNYYVGLNLRKFLNDDGATCVSIGGGVNFTALEYHDDYTDLFGSGFSFYDLKPKLGFYLKTAANVYFGTNWFISGNVQYIYTNAYIDESDYKDDGNNLLIGAAIGFAL